MAADAVVDAVGDAVQPTQPCDATDVANSRVKPCPQEEVQPRFEALNPWDELQSEIQKLTEHMPKGVSVSEDYAMYRVCTVLGRLRQRHGGQTLQACGGGADARPGGGAIETGDCGAPADGRVNNARAVARSSCIEELVELRVALAADEQRLRIRQARIEEARSQVVQVQELRRRLEEDLERERESRLQMSESYARQAKETTLRAQLCQARLRATRQEVVQLQAALEGNVDGFTEAWGGVVRTLEAELDVANLEASEAKRQVEETLAAQLGTTTQCPTSKAEAEPPQVVSAASYPGSCAGVAGKPLLDQAMPITARATASGTKLRPFIGARPAGADVAAGAKPSSTSSRRQPPPAGAGDGTREFLNGTRGRMLGLPGTQARGRGAFHSMASQGAMTVPHPQAQVFTLHSTKPMTSGADSACGCGQAASGGGIAVTAGTHQQHSLPHPQQWQCQQAPQWLTSRCTPGKTSPGAEGHALRGPPPRIGGGAGQQRRGPEECGRGPRQQELARPVAPSAAPGSRFMHR